MLNYKKLSFPSILYSCSYVTLCLIRIVLVLLPQIGYIHPDEHFQGPEVVYGDLLQLKVYKPWEFTSESPIRTIVFPYITSGVPSLLFKVFDIKEWAGSFYPYLLLVVPRLLMCGLSFLQDILLYKVCVLMKKDHQVCLMIFASSYVTLVFLTRTFSNSLESLFFSCMVYLLCKFEKYKITLSNIDQRSCDIRSLVNLSFIFGVLTALGVFNRPTFMCYCIFPILRFTFLLINCNTERRQSLNCFILFGLGGLSVLISFTAIDTLYYNRIHYSMKDYYNMKFISTPLNFVLYNTDNNNLYNHGQHARWLHSLINVPMLFSVYGILMNIMCFVCFYDFIKVPYINWKNLVCLLYITPLFLLSVIPHQEPRFIIPLIFPVALLFKEVTDMISCRKVFILIWFLQNTLAVIFFGFLHQGGVYTSSNFIHSLTQSNASYSVVFYKTYMPPRYLLGLDQDRGDIQVYDFAGVDSSKLEALLEEKKRLFRPQFWCIVSPQEVVDQVINLPSIVSDLKFFRKKSIFPHLRTESLFDNIEVINATGIHLYNNLTLKEALSISILIFKYM